MYFECENDDTVQQIVKTSQFETVKGLLESPSSIQRDIYLNILQTLAKDIKIKNFIRQQANQNLNAYNTVSEVAIFINEIIESGLDEETKVKIMFLGNTTGQSIANIQIVWAEYIHIHIVNIYTLYSFTILDSL